MELKFVGLRDIGTLDDERLVLEAESKGNVGDFVLLAAKRGKKGGPAGGSALAYWFPDRDVDARDLIVLYTREGENGEKELKNGRKSHFFYWSLSNTVWDRKAPVLIPSSIWETIDNKD